MDNFKSTINENFANNVAIIEITPETIEVEVVGLGSDHVPTFGGAYEGGIQVQQVPDEIAPFLYDIISSGKPINSYLEIGAAAGGTTYLIDHFLHPRTIVLIDDNRHSKAHVRPYILSQVKYDLIAGNSHADGTVTALRGMDTLFDLILIDGDHSYESVKIDVLLYRQFLAPGGLLVFHDSAFDTFGVKAVVQEMKDAAEDGESGLEFVNEYVGQKGHVCGIAVFRKVEVESTK